MPEFWNYATFEFNFTWVSLWWHCSRAISALSHKRKHLLRKSNLLLHHGNKIHKSDLTSYKFLLWYSPICDVNLANFIATKKGRDGRGNQSNMKWKQAVAKPNASAKTLKKWDLHVLRTDGYFLVEKSEVIERECFWTFNQAWFSNALNICIIQSKAWSIQICEYCLLYGDNQIFILLEKGKFSWLETWACNQGLVQVLELVQREHPKLVRAMLGTILPREDECTRSNEKFSIRGLWYENVTIKGSSIHHEKS